MKGLNTASRSASGIPGQLSPMLYRVEASRNRTTGGTGLGPAIAKQILPVHSGKVEAATSRLGGERLTV